MRTPIPQYMESQTKKEVTVQRVDHLPKIGAENGFLDIDPIWNDPDNAELKALRKDPCILAEGDVVFLPEKVEEKKLEPVPTDLKHRFLLKGKRPQLRIVLKSTSDKPISGLEVELSVGTPPERLITDASGLLAKTIARTSTEGQLQFKLETPEVEINAPLFIGGLQPVHTIVGISLRLNNLGYNVGEVDNSDSEFSRRFKSAVEEFQCDHELTVDGIPGPKTQKELEKQHGC
jgi:hypothetical protein